MTQARGQQTDASQRRGQVEQATAFDSPASMSWELTETELAQVAGGGDGPPTGPGDGTSVTNKATPILF
jgi:hypothetical protein